MINIRIHTSWWGMMMPACNPILGKKIGSSKSVGAAERKGEREDQLTKPGLTQADTCL